MRRFDSTRSYTIRTFFDALVHCPKCQSSRPMAIKTIKPGGFGGKDQIIYQCIHCEAETSRFGE
jgi:DNA-directed RNA polymerase subunit RPC12/RpoP